MHLTYSILEFSVLFIFMFLFLLFFVCLFVLLLISRVKGVHHPISYTYVAVVEMSGTCNRYGHCSQMFKCSFSLLGNVIFNMHTNMNFQELIKGKCLRLVNLLKYISLTVFFICEALLGNLNFSIIVHSSLECLLIGAHWSMK